MKRSVLVASVVGVCLVVVLGAAATQAVVPRHAPLGIPADGEVGTLVIDDAITNINDGRGIVEAELPYTIDGKPVRLVFPAVVTPSTWVRLSGVPFYVPARLLPTRDSAITDFANYVTEGDAHDGLRVLVRRQGDRLTILRIDPASIREVLASAPKVDSLGDVDFSTPGKMSGVVRGSSQGELGPDVLAIDFNVSAAVDDFPVWVKMDVVVPDSVRLSRDGEPLEMNELTQPLDLEPFEVLSQLTENRTVLEFVTAGSGLQAASIDGSSLSYSGPVPGDNGLLEEQINGF